MIISTALTRPRRATSPWLLAALFTLPTATIALAAQGEDVGDPVAGRQLAERWCASCHVFPGSDHAIATGAPSFAAVAADKSVTALSLRAFLQTPHDRMPDLHLSNDETDDLIAFVLSTSGR